MTKRRRMINFLLTAVLLTGLLPASAFAQENEDGAVYGYEEYAYSDEYPAEIFTDDADAGFSSGDPAADGSLSVSASALSDALDVQTEEEITDADPSETDTAGGSAISASSDPASAEEIEVFSAGSDDAAAPLLFAAAVGDEITYNDLVYTVTASGEVQLTSRVETFSDTNVVIPQTITNNGTTYTVTAIAGSVFMSVTFIESVTIPGSVKTIGINAFYGCSNLRSLSLGEGLQRIRAYAFANTGLTSITIPSSVEVIEYYAFDGTALKTAKYAGTETQWQAISISSNNQTLLNAYNATRSNHTISTAWTQKDGRHYHACAYCEVRFDEADCTGGTATCAAQANCSVCQNPYGEKNSANHTGGTEVRGAKSASCTESGYTGDTCCTGCGAVLNGGEATAALGHSFSSYAPNQDATCLADGTKTAKCDRCSATDTVTDTDSRLAHSMTHHAAAAATCTSEGCVEYWSCSACGQNYDSADGANVLNEVTTAIDPSNHTGGTETRGAKSAACTGSGYTGDIYCTGCGALLDGGETTAALGHSFSSYAPNQDATCLADGTKTAKCDRCSATDTVTDADSRLAHSMTHHAAVAATCTSEGCVEYWSCSACGQNYDSADGANVLNEVTTAIDASNHTGGTEIRGAKSASCSEAGYTGDTCCASCGAVLAAGTDIEKPSHSYGSWTVTKSASVLSEGTKQRTCSTCGHIREKTISRLTNPATLPAKGVRKGDKSIRLTWKEYSGAQGYEIYGSVCDGKNNYRLLTRTSKTSYTQKNLNKSQNYKYYVKAYCYVDGKKVYLAKSPNLHVAMKSSAATNASKVTVNKTNISLTTGETFRLKATITLQNEKEKLLSHVNSCRYYTSDKAVATVSSSGQIQARACGTCKIYAVTPSGLWKTVTVTVK